MLNQTEHIQQLRQQISRQYLVSGGVAIGIVLTGGFVYLCFNDNLIINAMAIQLAWLGLAFTWYLINHRQNLLNLLRDDHNIAYEPIEVYILSRKQKWDKFYPVFLLIGVVITAGFFYSMLVTDNDITAQVLAGLLVSYLLAMIWKNWLDFKDKILLQDIRHRRNDHSS